MKIGFDAKRLFNNFTGLGNYSRFIVGALSRYASENKYYLFTPTIKKNAETEIFNKLSNIHVVTPNFFCRASHTTSLWRAWGMSFNPNLNHLDIYHGLSQELPMQLPSHVKKVITVHDLIFMRFPHLYNPIDAKIYEFKVKSACKRADKIIAISKQTAQDLIDFLQVDKQKIEVVYQGCHPIFKKKISSEEKKIVQNKYDLPDEYILNVGTIEERKNVKLLVKALSLLPVNECLPLVIVGRETRYKQEVIQCAKEGKVLDKIIFHHQVSFQDFPALFQSAKAFVYPSLFEGFGIPLLEAIESGIPVITSTGSCFMEAAGLGALYVDPYNAEALAAQLIKVISDTDLRNRMTNQSAKHIAQFQPDKIAYDMHKVYCRLLTIEN